MKQNPNFSLRPLSYRRQRRAECHIVFADHCDPRKEAATLAMVKSFGAPKAIVSNVLASDAIRCTAGAIITMDGDRL